MNIIENMDNMQQETEIENLFDKVTQMLSRHGHVIDEIVCVLWGDRGSKEPDISIDLESFWKYAKTTTWDRDDWVSGPHYPMALLSGKGWWIEVVEYDSRTSLAWREEPKMAKPIVGISKDGELKALGKME